MHNEIWKDIKGYEGLYQVSNIGRVKRLERYRLNRWGRKSYYPETQLALCKDGKKYLFVKFTKNKVRVSYKVHRLVGDAFLEKKKGFNQINHKDFDKNNNIVSNLEWSNDYENQSHKSNSMKGRTSDFIGVHFKKNLKLNPWVAAIGIDGVSIHLGCFSSEKMAHIAYLKALKDNGIENKYAN
jgi:hypothetical protein